VVQRIFAQISPKNSKKTTAFHYIFGTFLSMQSASGTIFAKFSLNCPQKPKKRPPKKRKNVCTLIDFASMHINRFCECFHTFCTNFHSFSPDFKGFCPNFYKIKTLGGALAPPPPTPMILGHGPLVSPLATPTLPNRLLLQCCMQRRIQPLRLRGGGDFSNIW